MPDLKILLAVTPCNAGSLLTVEYALKRQDSKELSLFQAIGRMYRTMDVIIQTQPSYASGAAHCFDALFRKYGYPVSICMHELLSLTQWRNRMCLAWRIVASVEKEFARQLDYDEYHNYWPNADFCDESWDAEVEDWELTQRSRPLVKIDSHYGVSLYSDSD